MNRIMAIDYGERRVGLAVTDPLQISANGLDTVDRSLLENFLASYFVDHNVETVVLGYPTHADGNPLTICKKIDDFIDYLNKTYPTLNVEKIDENFTSAEAMQKLIEAGVKQKKRRDKKLLDKVSAILILQRYLNH
ncbi:UNVERIFIED_CONTAM: hypothetical protein GTU68_014844 [Idotea baltica]|nr:hypothetical protein [Idotea baltica]